MEKYSVKAAVTMISSCKSKKRILAYSGQRGCIPVGPLARDRNLGHMQVPAHCVTLGEITALPGPFTEMWSTQDCLVPEPKGTPVVFSATPAYHPIICVVLVL